MPGGDLAGRQRQPHRLRQVEQPQEIADRRAVHAELFGQLFDGAAERVEVFAERLGLFEVAEVFPLQVFFEGVFAGRLVDDVDDPAGNGRQARLDRGLPATFASDDLKSAIDFADKQRLQNAVFLDAGGEFAERLGIELTPRLERIAGQLVDRQIAEFRVVVRGDFFG